MKREYWENLGLEHELINLIMAENGKDIESLRKRAETLESERDEIIAKRDEFCRRIKIEELFSREKFACDLIRDLAVEKFINANLAPEEAENWLADFREAEPFAFKAYIMPDDLPRFSIEKLRSDETAELNNNINNKSQSFLARLKKLR